MTPQEKIARMQSKQQATKEQALKDRQVKWQQIQTEFPDIAQALIDINKTFGKPKAVGIRRNNGEVAFVTGEFDKPKDLRVQSDNRRKRS